MPSESALYLHQLDQNLWVIDHPFKLLGACLGTRTTVIRLLDDSLLLHSPGAGLSSLKTELEQLGPVNYLLAPNTMHHLALPATAKLFPAAKIYGPAGLKAKQSGLQILEPESAAWAAELPIQLLSGFGQFEERAFFHAPSRSLLLTDLVFNIQQTDHSWTRLFMSLNDGYGKFGPTRMARSMIKNKALMSQTLTQLLAWDFERVIMSHGDVLEHNGKQALKESFAKWGVVGSR